LQSPPLREIEQPNGDYFSSSIIWPAHTEVIRNWEFLHRGYRDEELVKTWIRDLSEYTMCSYDALQSLHAITTHALDIELPGVFVETGCCSGGASALMAMSINAHRNSSPEEKSRSGAPLLHLFDSFQGLPHPSETDEEEWMYQSWALTHDDFDGALTPTTALRATQEQVIECVCGVAGYARERVVIHKGWFQDTVPAAVKLSQITEIALLRLDGDLYESTKVCLEYLYPLVVSGGFVFIDDYGLKGCAIAVEEYLNSVSPRPFLHYVDATVRYLQKP
jgi:hypothetical protein